ncbi:MAG: sigma-54 dependent transcriptional regulator [Desulforegulaceae bacterium]|nr:sigma-54 dependent transcriptional regulator [Desulforegulaceae bacterium]
MSPHILVVDDEKAILKLLTEMLRDEGFVVSSAQNGYEALKQIEKEEPDLVLLDIYLPGINGIETLQEIKKINNSIPVIIISSYGNIDNAVYATKLGAYDFIEKPLAIDKTLVAIKNALEYQRLEEENRYLKKKNLDKNSFTGNSEVINELKGKLFQAAMSDENILVYGENGTGKKLAARNIHFLSKRSEFEMVTINCACLPKESAEKTLFGCSKGFLSPDSPRVKGKLELADSSTLYLDEINALDLKTQEQLLEFIETKEITRLGESREIKINTRIISSTSVHLEKEDFRKDLFYRLNVVNINLPPLRERKEDIKIIAEHFLKEASFAYNTEKKELSQKTFEILENHDWPGNVRELKNFINSITLMIDKGNIEPEDLPMEFSYLTDKTPRLKTTENLIKTNNYNLAMKEFEKIFIKQKFEEFENDIEKTAKETGLTKEEIEKIVKD